MGGELCLKIKKVSFSDDMVKFYGKTTSAYIDMHIYEERNLLHLCGENDWGYLLVSALQPLLNYASDVKAIIDSKIEEYAETPEAIGLGKNEYRALDITHRLANGGKPIEEYKGIPIIKLTSNDETALLGRVSIPQLPQGEEDDRELF